MELDTSHNMPGRVGTPEERFWKKVRKTPHCWEWSACLNSQGYGVFFFNGKNVAAHRFSYFLTDPAADSTLNVLHKCDNPKCVNPEHLFLGTLRDNMLDMVRKQRRVYHKGNAHSRTKYSEELKLLINSSEISAKEAYQKWGMSKATFSRIRKETSRGIG